MKIKIEAGSPAEGVAVLSVRGEADACTAPTLRQAIMRQLDAGSRRVLVNLTDVAYLDATGLGVLVSGLRCAKEYSGDLRVICSNDRTVKIFELTGLNRVFDIYPTEAAALATL